MIPTVIKNYFGLLKAIASESEKESCGIITARPQPKVVQLENLAEDAINNFAISPFAIAPYLGNILCLWHTHTKSHHPDMLTISDIEICRALNVPGLMIHTQTQCSDYYEPSNPDPFPAVKNHRNPKSLNFYAGWQCNELLWGRTDCFEVVRCYYLGMLGIDIGNFRRPDFKGFPPLGWKTPWVAEEHGFYLVDESEAQAHDIVEIALSGGRASNHLAVITDSSLGYILHQPGFGHASQVQKFGTFWRGRIAIDEATGKKRILRNRNV